MKRGARKAAARPMGTLMKRIHCQPATSVSTPPSSTPAAPPAPPIAPHAPSALLRSEPSVKVVVMIARLAGEMIAPPSPWVARAAISIPWLEASPPTSEATEISSRPPTNTRLRPSRSAIRPPSSRKPANASVYAFTTHWRPAPLKPRSARIDGSATFTTDTSRITMNWATHASTTAAQRARDAAASLTRRACSGCSRPRPPLRRAAGGAGADPPFRGRAARALHSLRGWRWRRSSAGPSEGRVQSTTSTVPNVRRASYYRCSGPLEPPAPAPAQARVPAPEAVVSRLPDAREEEVATAKQGRAQHRDRSRAAPVAPQAQRPDATRDPSSPVEVIDVDPPPGESQVGRPGNLDVDAH